MRLNRLHRVLIMAILLTTPVIAVDVKEGVTLTVYNGGYGVVREIRLVDVHPDGRVQFQDVATGIDPTTVHFKSLTDPGAKLLEQNYQYDLVSADRLLQKYIDRAITVVGPGNSYEGKLLSFDNRQIVLNGAEGIMMVQRPDNVRDIRFGPLPEGLLTRPTLLWLVATRQPGQHLAEVTYQTSGLTWHAEYVLVLNKGDTSAGLSGWVSIENNSGKRYSDAGLKFVAGDVHRAAAPRKDYRNRVTYAAESLDDAEPMRQKAFFEYHLYTLPRRSTVANREVKQLEMFSPVSGMEIEKRYVYNPLASVRGGGGRHMNREFGLSNHKKVQVFIEFQNSEEHGPGIPLPAGKVRAYKQDPDDGTLEFVGEERIDHTPKDEEISLRIGNAFDIVGQRRQTDFQLEKHRNWLRESIEIVVRNHKDIPVTVRVREPMYRWTNWRISAKSHASEKLDARTIAFDVPVPAGGEAVTTYTVEYTW